MRFCLVSCHYNKFKSKNDSNFKSTDLLPVIFGMLIIPNSTGQLTNIKNLFKNFQTQ